MVSGCYPSTDWPCEKHCMEFCDGHPSDEVGSQEQLKREDGVGRSLTKPGGGGGLGEGKHPPSRSEVWNGPWTLFAQAGAACPPCFQGEHRVACKVSARSHLCAAAKTGQTGQASGRELLKFGQPGFCGGTQFQVSKNGLHHVVVRKGVEVVFCEHNRRVGQPDVHGVLHSGAPIECQAGGLLFGELEHGKGRLFGQMESSAKVVGHRSCSCCLNCIGNSAGVLLGPDTAQHSGFEVLWPGQLVGLPHPSLLLKLVEDRLVFLRSEGFCGDRGHLNSIAGARSLGSWWCWPGFVGPRGSDSAMGGPAADSHPWSLFAGFSDGGCSRTSWPSDEVHERQELGMAFRQAWARFLMASFASSEPKGWSGCAALIAAT